MAPALPISPAAALSSSKAARLAPSSSALAGRRTSALAPLACPRHRPAAYPPSAAPQAAAEDPAQGYVINVIPKSAWPNGVPPVMGAHLMASGVVAPVSTSKGAGGAEQGIAPHEFTYPQGEASTRVVVHATARAASLGLTRLVADSAKRAIAERGSFALVLSGGSLIDALAPLAGSGGGSGGGGGGGGSGGGAGSSGVGAPAAASAAAAAAAESLDWSRTHVFWVDERVVPHASPDSNAGAAQKALLDRVPIPAENVHAIAEGLGAAQAAAEYHGRLLGLPAGVLPRVPFAGGGEAKGEEGATTGAAAAAAGALLPRFDLILLGVGPDGHVASLFPNAPATASQSPDIPWVLAVTDSPKPPPQRITFSMPVINAAAEVVVVALGAGKAEVVQRALECQALPGALPAQLVRPSTGALWLLDAAAAQALDLGEWEGMKAFPRSAK